MVNSYSIGEVIKMFEGEELYLDDCWYLIKDYTVEEGKGTFAKVKNHKLSVYRKGELGKTCEVEFSEYKGEYEDMETAEEINNSVAKIHGIIVSKVREGIKPNKEYVQRRIKEIVLGGRKQ